VVLVVLNNLPPACGRLLVTSASATIVLDSLDAPIEDVVILVAFSNKEVSEELEKVRIVGFIVKLESTSVVKEDAKLVGKTATETISGGSHLLLHDTIVFLLLESLAREGTAEEVRQHIGEGFEIIAAGLLDAQMGVDGRGSRRSGQVFVFSIRDVKMGLRVSELLRKTEINDIGLMATLANSHEEIVGLDISMNEISGVDISGT
jgi:hypothetical protein